MVKKKKTEIATKDALAPNLNSKKGRQDALKQKLDEIDARLAELGDGVNPYKYKIISAITNPESPSNSININNLSNLSQAMRMLAYYKNIKETNDEFCKVHKVGNHVLVNTNTFIINDIISDIEHRALTLANAQEINTLRAIKSKLTPFLNEESRFISALNEVSTLLKS